MPNCNDCQEQLNSTNWYPSLKEKGSKVCISCHKANNKKWRKKNKEYLKIKARGSYKKYASRCRRWMRDNRQKLRIDMIKAYGEKCSHCGITDSEVLDIDHINNDGGKDRKKGVFGYKLYKLLKDNGYPTGNYQLLCKNCNWKKELQRRRKS